MGHPGRRGFTGRVRQEPHCGKDSAREPGLGLAPLESDRENEENRFGRFNGESLEGQLTQDGIWECAGRQFSAPPGS